MKNSTKAVIWGLSAVFIWAAIPAFVKIGSTTETLAFLLVCRFLIASLFFLHNIPGILKKVSEIHPGHWLLLAGILGANYFFQGLAMIELPVSWYLVIFCLNPILSLVFLGLKLNRKTIFCLLVSVVGTLMFLSWEEISKLPSKTPFIYITIGMLTWVAYTVLIKKFQNTYSNIQTTGITQFVSLFACLGIWLVSGLDVIQLNTTQLVSIGILGVATPLAYFGFNACLRIIPRFSIVSQYLEPVFGIFIGFILFGESLSTAQLAGAALIVASMVILEN
ncbi:MAG: DMT family transporter [Pseudobdellovibrionaceae bacterium]